MAKLIIIWLIFFGLAGSLNAQETQNFQSFDDTTYALYQQKDWLALIKKGKEAIHSGFDYFYLRMRMGIAYYKLGRFRKAIPHFNKALQMNSGSAEAAEYLYYALGYSMRFQERNLFYNQHKNLLSQRVKFEEQEFLDYLHLNGGFKVSEGIREIGGQNFFQTGMGNQFFGGKLQIYHAYQQLSQIYNYPDTIRRGNRLFERWSSINYIQHEYYFNPTLQFGRGIKVAPAVHWQWGDLFDEIQTNYVFTLAANKTRPLWQIGINGSYGYINDSIKQQAGLNITFYPLGNNNLYLQADGQLVFPDEIKKPNSVITGKLGARLFKQTWVEGIWNHGTIYQFQENNGALMFNSPDKITARWGLRGVKYGSTGNRYSIIYFFEKKSSVFYNGNYTHYTIAGDIIINF